MFKPAAIRKFLACACLSLPGAPADAASDRELEAGLLDALRLKAGTVERLGDSGTAIQAYMREGVAAGKPNRRFEYTDYYLLKKPAKFMGHDLVLIEEEYPSKFIGCCVNPGAGVTVRVVGDSRNLEEFAEANGCTLTDNLDLQDLLKQLKIKASLPRGNFASLSCRERDVNR
jgi:hypothetical protein